MNHGDWQDANTHYIAAAVAWVRALLRERVKPPAAAQRLAQPGPPARPGSTQQGQSFWRSVGRRRVLVSEPAPLPETELIAIPSGDRASAAAAEMSGIAAAMTRPPALLTLAKSLGLSDFERNVLLLCAATELDTSVAGLCAQAQGDPARPYPTFALALTLFDDAAWESLAPERPLRYWRLIEISQSGATPLTVSALRADERIVNLLKGVTYLDERLTPLLTALPDPEGDVPASQRAVAESIVDQLRVIQAHEAPAIQLLGVDAVGKQVVASVVCHAFGLQPYRLDARALPAMPAELDSLARLWLRESSLLSVALYLDADGVDGAHSASIDTLLARLDGVPVFVASRHLRPVAGRAPIAADVAKPTPSEQRECWAAALGDAAGAIPGALAAQFSLNAATIRELAHRATADPHADTATLQARLWDATRALTRPQVDTLAHHVVPRATWHDIVLPAAETALLHQIADQVGHRDFVYRRWGFARLSRGAGISVLFAGASGSGKTLAAEVLASHLRLDLFRIDLSAVMSKYIGETEANLRRLFDAAEDGGVILFFDEADALFGKRTEVKDSHDRYANIEINYLLQRMESYGGLAILATNMKSALDQAFMRRLRFVVDFPFPGVPERTAMWRRAFPVETPIEGIDAERLARLNVVGGNIAVIALNAAFAAARVGTPVTMPLVFAAARDEFRKLGLFVNEAEFQWKPPAEVVA
jgi:hypothetical protein